MSWNNQRYQGRKKKKETVEETSLILICGFLFIYFFFFEFFPRLVILIVSSCFQLLPFLTVSSSCLIFIDLFILGSSSILFFSSFVFLCETIDRLYCISSRLFYNFLRLVDHCAVDFPIWCRLESKLIFSAWTGLDTELNKGVKLCFIRFSLTPW